MTASPSNPVVSMIVRAVAEQFGVSEGEIMSASSARRVAYPRFVCMSLARELTSFSAGRIGRQLSRDRTTVKNGFHRFDRLVASEPSFCEAVEEVRRRCRDALAGGCEANDAVRQRARKLFNHLAADISAADPVALIQRVSSLAVETSELRAATEPPWGSASTPAAPAAIAPAQTVATIAVEGDVPRAATEPPWGFGRSQLRPTPLARVYVGACDFGVDSRAAGKRLASMNAAHLNQVLAAGSFNGARRA